MNLSFGVVGLVTNISATIFVYAGQKDYERSIADSRASTLTSTLTNWDVNVDEIEAGAHTDDERHDELDGRGRNRPGASCTCKGLDRF